MTDDPYAVLAELVDINDRVAAAQDEYAFSDELAIAWARAKALVAAHRAGQRTEQRPDLIDADGDRWVWRGRRYGPSGAPEFSWWSREQVEAKYGPVTEAGAAEAEEASNA